MKIETRVQDTFIFNTERYHDFIVVEDKRIADYMEYINKNDINSVEINEEFYNKDNLDFLKNCPNVLYVIINSNLLTNLNGLYSLKKLNGLDYNENLNVELDLTRFAYLRLLGVRWSEKLKGLEQSTKLVSLGISSYKPKSKSLQDLSTLVNLSKLSIIYSNLTSLEGIEKLSNLTELNLLWVNNLVSIDSLIYITKTLDTLFIQSCKKISDISVLKELEFLKKLTLMRCGKINSISFVRHLPNLNYIAFPQTNVVDGDITPCLDIKEVNFTYRKHYSHHSSHFKNRNRKII